MASQCPFSHDTYGDVWKDGITHMKGPQYHKAYGTHNDSYYNS